MKALSIAWNDFKVIIKDKNALIALLLMPFIIISILGFIFGDSEMGGLNAFDVAVYSEDEGYKIGNILKTESSDDTDINMGNVLVEEVFKGEELKETMIIKEVGSREEGEKLVRQGKVSAFVYVPKSFTVRYVMDKECQIEVLGDPKRMYTPKIVKSVVESFIDELNVIHMKIKQINETAKKYNISASVLDKYIKDILDSNVTRHSIKIIENEVENRKVISGMAYYAAAVSVMFVLFCGQEGAERLLLDRRRMTALRIFAAPVSRATYLLGKLIGIIMMVVAQMLVLITSSSIVYGVQWGNVAGIILMTVALALSIGCIALVIGFVAMNNESALRWFNLCIWVFSFLGGTFIPSSQLPIAIQKLGVLTPNGQAVSGYLKIMQGADISQWIAHAGILLAAGFVFFIIGVNINKGRMVSV